MIFLSVLVGEDIEHSLAVGALSDFVFAHKRVDGINGNAHVTTAAGICGVAWVGADDGGHGLAVVALAYSLKLVKHCGGNGIG